MKQQFNISKKLKELRIANKKTQKQIAIYLNMSVTGYASQEQGLSEPSVLELRKLCILYEIDRNEILGLDNNTYLSVNNSFNKNSFNNNDIDINKKDIDINIFEKPHKNN